MRARADVQLDVSAPYLKSLLAVAFAKALSELPKETVLHCWAPLQAAFDDMNALHAKAAERLERLFPNKATHDVPDAIEEEPSSDADDDYEEPPPRWTSAQRKRAEAERAEHARAANAAVANGAPARRPSRTAAAAANAAMDVLDARGELA